MSISRKGRRRMWKGQENRLIPPDQINKALDSGWQFGMPPESGTQGTTYIHNPVTAERRMIKKDKVQSYLDKGWVLGLPKGLTQNATWIKKDGQEKKVSFEDLDQHLADGWVRGRVHTTADRVWMHKDDEYRMILKSDVRLFEQQGYVVGGHMSFNTCLRWVYKETTRRLIPQGELKQALADGWHVGFHLSWIFKGNEYRRVPVEQVDDLVSQGWTAGMPCGYAHVLKEGVERHIPKTQLADYQKQGWTLGTLSGNQQPLSGVFLIYKLTSPEGKIYIGLTKDITRRIREHSIGMCNRHLHAAILKYGFETFKQEILVENLTIEEAEEQEAAWIAFFESNTPDKGYNQASGGRLGATYNALACQANRERQLNRIKPQRG